MSMVFNRIFQPLFAAEIICRAKVQLPTPGWQIPSNSGVEPGEGGEWGGDGPQQSIVSQTLPFEIQKSTMCFLGVLAHQNWEQFQSRVYLCTYFHIQQICSGSYKNYILLYVFVDREVASIDHDLAQNTFLYFPESTTHLTLRW